MTKSIYDFSDTSDLPEDIAAKLAVSSGGESPVVQQLVDLVNGAPMALSMAQIIAVATRAGVELPAATTVRGYIVEAAKAGRIARPSRQTYGPIGGPVEPLDPKTDEEVPTEEVDDVLAADPLADI